MKNARRLMLVVCLLLLVGCGDSDSKTESPVKDGDVKNVTAPGGTVTPPDAGAVQGTMEKLNAEAQTWVKQMSETVSSQSGQIADLKKTAADKADDQLKKLLGQLDGKLALVQTKLKEIQSADGNSFEKLKSELEPAMAELTKLYGQAMTKASGLLPEGMKVPGL